MVKQSKRVMKLRLIASDLAAWADEIENDLENGKAVPSDDEHDSRAGPESPYGDMVKLAKALYGSRRSRERVIKGDFFGETSWDMLLTLYINSLEARKITVTTLCSASMSPLATALRWIVRMEKDGLLKREQSTSDKRVYFCHLTKKGVNCMHICLSNILEELRDVSDIIASPR